MKPYRLMAKCERVVNSCETLDQIIIANNYLIFANKHLRKYKEFGYIHDACQRKFEYFLNLKRI